MSYKRKSFSSAMVFESGVLPLINISLLLLVVFLVVGKLDSPFLKDVEEARSEHTIPDSGSGQSILVMTAENVIYYQNTAYTDLTSFQARFAADQQNRPHSLVFKADQRAHARAVLRLLQFLKSQDIDSVSLQLRPSGSAR